MEAPEFYDRPSLNIETYDSVADKVTPVNGPLEHPDRGRGRMPASGNEVRIRATHRIIDTLNQVLTERWEFVEVDPEGRELRREEEILRMRWTYRWEMRYLLELAGFEVEAEYSDFHRSPPAYAAEQVWLARRR
jgi:hypothetical protein